MNKRGASMLPFNTRPSSEGQIQKLENYIGCKMPESYRSFLLLHNGGIPSRNLFKFTPRKEWKVAWSSTIQETCLEELWSVTRVSTSTMTLREAYEARYYDLPRDLLSIGCLSANKDLVIGLIGPRRGKVCVAAFDIIASSHGLDADTGMVEVAGTFHQFIKLLYTDD